jgi:hypothetical protein
MADTPTQSECEKAQQTVINLLKLLLSTLGTKQELIDAAVVS